MLTLNPHGKVVEEIYIPRGRSFFKEECLCTPGMPRHWNIIYQIRHGDRIAQEVTVIGPVEDEKLVDYCMNIISEGDDLIDWTL